MTDQQLDARLQRDIEAVARLMTFANLSVNSVSLLARRLRRVGAADGARVRL